MNIVYSLDLIGTLVFAISGALTASNKKFDLFGGAVIAFVTALGGGTIRDILIGSQPVGWMKDANYLYLIFAALIICMFFKKHVLKLQRTMFLFDTIGIALFTISGMKKTLEMGLSPAVAIIMGIVSAVFGGVLRDILTNEIPLIFRKEIYATACLLGGLLFWFISSQFQNENIPIIATVFFIIIIRILAVKRNWALPTIR